MAPRVFRPPLTGFSRPRPRPREYPAETNAVVLLDDESLTVTGPGQAEVHTAAWCEFCGRRAGKRRSLGYLSSGEKIQSLHAWSIDSAGRQYEIKEKEFADSSPFYGEMYSDIHYRLAEAPAGNPGSVVAFEYSVKRKLWMDQWSWFFQENIPVDEARLHCSFPAVGSTRIVGPTIRRRKRPAGPSRWQWVCHNLPGIPDEVHSPYRYALAGHMELAFFEPAAASNLGSWKAIGDWYYKLSAGARCNSGHHCQSAAVDGKCFFLRRQGARADLIHPDRDSLCCHRDRHRRLSAAPGAGHLPHALWGLQRQGDAAQHDAQSCWHRLGLRAGAHRARRGEARCSCDRLQPCDSGDRTAAGCRHGPYRSVVKTFSGTPYLIFDPTDEYTPVGDLRSGLQGSYGLLATPNGGELIKLPVLPPDSNLVDREGKFTLHADGSLSGDVTERLTGTHAARQRALLAAKTTASERRRSITILGYR